MTFADCRMQMAVCISNIYQVPFPLLRANCEQANMNAIKANLSYIGCKQNAI